MRTIVTNIRQSGAPEEFVVEALVDGIEESFRLRVTLPDLLSVQPIGRRFLDVFEYSMAPRKIAGLVVGVYKGQPADFLSILEMSESPRAGHPAPRVPRARGQCASGRGVQSGRR